MLTLQRLRLDSDSYDVPNSGLLLPQTSRGNWLTRESGTSALDREQPPNAYGRLRHPHILGRDPQAALVLTGMWLHFTEGASRFLS